MFTAATIMKMVAAGRFRTWAASAFFPPNLWEMNGDDPVDGLAVKPHAQPPKLTNLAPSKCHDQGLDDAIAPLVDDLLGKMAAKDH